MAKHLRDSHTLISKKILAENVGRATYDEDIQVIIQSQSYQKVLTLHEREGKDFINVETAQKKPSKCKLDFNKVTTLITSSFLKYSLNYV